MEGVWRGIVCVLLLLTIEQNAEGKFIMTTDEMENYINPEDLKMIMDYYRKNSTLVNEALLSTTTTQRTVESVGCYGMGGRMVRFISSIFSFNFKPASSDDVNTHFYFSSRKMKFPVQVYPGKQFDLVAVDFDPKRKTVLIVHGFMSYSGADWVTSMTKAYLDYEDVNVIAVDWSGGSKTFRYWRAVANTRTVGDDIVKFFGQLKNETKLNIKKCHFIGHSLGAHIVSFASYTLGKVERITGLDPALPCFNTTDPRERLDPTDADFVDVIHTNGKLTEFAFGFPYPSGHLDFYPNGGIRQPGCLSSKIPVYNMLDQAICSHGRAYLLFTESLTNRNCRFRGSQWDLTVPGLRKSVSTTCGANNASCPEMGIRATRNANGRFLVLTEDKVPYCVSDWQHHLPSPDLLEDITNFLQHLTGHTTSSGSPKMTSIVPYSIADGKKPSKMPPPAGTSKAKSDSSPGWFTRFINYIWSRKEQIPEEGKPEDS